MYDFFVIGCGASGSVIASRLAEKYSVAVLEAKGNYTNNRLIKSPHNPGLLWGNKLYTPPYNPPFDELEFKTTEGFDYPRGIGFGGSTAHNAMLAYRGNASVYNKWAKNYR